MKVLLLCGSLRVGSTNEAVLLTAQRLAALAHDQAEYHDRLAALPHFNPDDDREPLHPEVAMLRTRIAAADALLICTPEYAGDMPGAFKNLLDWTVGGVETEQKPVGWINVSMSPNGAAGTHEMLRVVLTYTGCDIADDACVHLPVPRTMIEDGIVADAALRGEIAAVLDALRDHVQSVKARAQPR